MYAIPSWLATLRDYALVIAAIAAAAAVIGKFGHRCLCFVRKVDAKVDKVLYELSDNGGGSFKDWVKGEFAQIKEFQDESRADRCLLHEQNVALNDKFDNEIARTKLAEDGVIDDRGRRTDDDPDT